MHDFTIYVFWLPLFLQLAAANDESESLRATICDLHSCLTESDKREETLASVHDVELNELRVKLASGQDMRRTATRQAKHWRSRENFLLIICPASPCTDATVYGHLL